MFEDDPGLSLESGSCQDSSKVEQRKTAYRCRKCRRVIAVEGNVISHVPGEGESCFDWNRRKSGHPYNNKEHGCSSLFVEPLKWMTPGRLDVITFLLEYEFLWKMKCLFVLCKEKNHASPAHMVGSRGIHIFS